MSDTDTIPVTQLIRLVRDRPVLWDRQQEVYKNRKMTRQAWAEISEILIDNYDELDEQNQLAVGRSLMGKWANLRDNWLRYWRKRQSLLCSGSKTTSLKKYIHHDQLLFLSKVYDPECRAVEENVEEIMVDVDLRPLLSDTDEEFIPDQNYDEASQNTWTLAEPAELPMQTDDDKCHLHFFHSILPMIQDLDDSQTLQLHADFLDCIRRVKFGSTDMSQKFVLNTTQKVDNSTSTEDLREENINEEIQDQANNLLVSQNKNSNTTNILISLNNKNTSLETKKPLNTSECHLEISNLNSIVGRLEQISDTFVYSSFGDNYEQFGKYIASLMRRVPQKRIPSLKRKLVGQVLKVKPSCRLTSTKNYLRNKANKTETNASRVPPIHPLSSSDALSTEGLPSTSELNLQNSFSSISLLSTSFEENNQSITHNEEHNISVSQQIPEAVTVQHKKILLKRNNLEVADSSNNSSLNFNTLEGDTNFQTKRKKWLIKKYK